MITTITSDNKQLYDNLFGKANHLLDKILSIKNNSSSSDDTITYNSSDESYDIFIDNINYHITSEQYDDLIQIDSADTDLYDTTIQGFKIDNLADYFSVLKSLSAIHPLFMRLPQNEEFFEIDANKRLINKPNNNNIYAVKGDNIAEIIYFKIDRYFDIVDLGSESISILIQATCKNKDGEEQNYLFPICTAKDLDSDPDKIIFGWALTNKITEIAGTVTFAVRFYNLSGGNLNYSFGTQPTTLNVVNGLLGDIDVTKIDRTQEVYLENYQRTGAIKVPVPTLLIDMKPSNNEDIIIETVEDPEEITVKAVADGANIQYVLYRRPINGDAYSKIEGLTSSPSYELVTEADFDIYKNNLYTQNNGIYTQVNEAPEEWQANTYYYQINTATWNLASLPNPSGEYFCQINAQSNRYTNKKESSHVFVCGASDVNWKEIENSEVMQDKIYVTTYNNETETYSYAPSNEEYIFNPNEMLETNSSEKENYKREGVLSLGLNLENITFQVNSDKANLEVYGYNTKNGDTSQTTEYKTYLFCKPLPTKGSMTITLNDNKINNIAISYAETSGTYSTGNDSWKYNLDAYSNGAFSSLDTNMTLDELKTKELDPDITYSVTAFKTIYGHNIEFLSDKKIQGLQLINRE